MASSQHLRDGLYSISWSIDGTNENQPFRVIVVKNPNIFHQYTGLLSFIISRQQIAYLEIEIYFPEEFTSVDIAKIMVHASKDGAVTQKMYLRQGKWSTSWNEVNKSNNYRPTTCSRNFQIFIDLNSPGAKNQGSLEKGFKPTQTSGSQKGSQHVHNYILNLWNTKILSDVTFNCQGKSIKAHTLILASGSPVLAAMFQNDFKEKQERVVDITDIEAKIFENLLQHIYTGEVALENEVEDVAELLIAADKYAVETLKEECALYLSNDLKVENAARYLVLAHLHNLTVLHEATLQFMSENAKAVCSRKEWMNVIKNYPELSFEATQRMVGL